MSNKRPLVVIAYFILPIIPVIKDYNINFHTVKESILSLTFNNSGIKKLIAEQEVGGGGDRDCKNVKGRLVTTFSSKRLIFVFLPTITRNHRYIYSILSTSYLHDLIIEAS